MSDERGADGCPWRALTACYPRHHSELQLLGAGPHVQLTLVVICVAVAATHGLPQAYALGGAKAAACLCIADSAERTVNTRLICGRDVCGC